MRRSAFTLIELLVVIAIIAILAAMLMPALETARDQAMLARCTSTLHNMLLANTMYANDWDDYSVHGKDMTAFWGPPPTYYGTNIFDDDWGNGKPGTPGRNPATNGAQNICHVGQLMYGGYLPETVESIACAQDYKYADSGKACSSIKGIRNKLNKNWKDEYYTGNPGYAYTRTNYGVRGPMFSMGKVQASSYALFCDWEQNRDNSLSGSPLPYWPVKHEAGINVGYVDGHAALYRDPDRSYIYHFRYVRYYGVGDGIQHGAFDNP